MYELILAACSFPILFLLIFMRVPIWLAMACVGLTGSFLIYGSVAPLLNQLKQATYQTFSNYSYSVIPMFLLMGQFAAVGGLSGSLFKAAGAWIGHRRGGVAVSAITACAGFSAICGSSLATAATMGQVALPELRRAGYSGALSTGCLAAGGTLGILIPPSIMLVIYAIMTEQNISKLFMAAFVPGVLAAIGYVIVVTIYVRLKPGSAGTSPVVPIRQRCKATLEIWPIMLIFLLVVGGIYSGIFTPMEGAAVGAVGTGLLALMNKGLNRRTFIDSLLETGVASGMIFMIILGAGFYNTFLAMSQLPQELATWVLAQSLSPWWVLSIILLVYLLLGCVMDSISMILLTIPIFFPMIMGLDFGLTPDETAIWFGILVLIVVELGLITPPVGMNLFIINGMAKGTPITETYRGVMPFIASDLVRTVILAAFPAITLFVLRL